MGDGATSIAARMSPLARAKDAPCEEYRSFLENPAADLPPAAKECFRKKFDLQSISNFRFFAGDSVEDAKEVKSMGELVRFRTSLSLFLYYYDVMHEPGPGLNFLVEAVRERTEKKPIRIFFSNETSPEMGAEFLFDTGAISIADMAHAKIGGACAPGRVFISTLYHELAHALMFAAYGNRRPNYEGNYGHDRDCGGTAKPIHEEKTNPGAAWSEGFAGALRGLDRDDTLVITEKDFASSDWRSKPLRDKLSNENMVKGVLVDYLSRCDAEEGRREHQRPGRIVEVIGKAGLEQSFQEYLVDHVYLYPGDRAEWTALLSSYGVVAAADADSFFSAPNYLERNALEKKIDAFIKSHDALSEYSLSWSESARAEKWRVLAAEGARARLLSKTIPTRERIALMKKIELILGAAARKSSDNPW